MPMPLADCVVIFDLDGTLVDSALDLSESLNFVLTHENLPRQSIDAARSMAGLGAIAMMTAGYKAAGMLFPEDDNKERLVDLFMNHYRENIAVRTVPFDDCVDTLALLKKAGAKLAVCTNKYTHLAEKLLSELSLSQYFECVLGRDALPEHKPSGMPLHEIIIRTNRSSAVMVGDTYTDRDAARAAGIPCALATFGYSALGEPLQPTEREFSRYRDLFSIITDLIATNPDTAS